MAAQRGNEYWTVGLRLYFSVSDTELETMRKMPNLCTCAVCRSGYDEACATGADDAPTDDFPRDDLEKLPPELMPLLPSSALNGAAGLEWESGFGFLPSLL